MSARRLGSSAVTAGLFLEAAMATFTLAETVGAGPCIAAVQRNPAMATLVLQRFRQRQAPLLVAGKPVVTHAGLRKGGDLRGQCFRRGARLAIRHDAIGEADGQCLV